MATYDIVGLAMVGGGSLLGYLYLLNERRKLLDARRKRRDERAMTPAE